MLENVQRTGLCPHRLPGEAQLDPGHRLSVLLSAVLKQEPHSPGKWQVTAHYAYCKGLKANAVRAVTQPAPASHAAKPLTPRHGRYSLSSPSENANCV